MELFVFGLIVGIVIGVWLAVAALYFFQSRGGARRTMRFDWPSRTKTATSRPSSSPPPKTAPAPAYTLSIKTVGEQEAFQRLANMVHSHATAERLVGYEHERRPYAPTLELIETAIERWIRDNH